MSYYDWATTLSKNADVTMVVSHRGKGKTYGLRRQFVRDWIKDGSRFCELCRYKEEVSLVAAEYFDKLIENGEFPEYIFRTNAKFAWIARKPEKKSQPDWKLMGYFGALTEMQVFKKRPFARVRRVVLDEAIIDNADQYHGYLKNEYYILSQMVDSLTREHPLKKGERPAAGSRKKKKPNVYLLANACSMANPYFRELGITRPPEFGARWYRDKEVWLDYVDPGEDGRRKLDETVAGRMLRGTKGAEMSAGNKFIDASGLFVEKKPKRAKYQFAIAHDGVISGVWLDETEGYIYVSPSNGRTPPVYALTSSETGEFISLYASRNEKVMQMLCDFYRQGLVRFDSDGTREHLKRCLALFGLR